MMPFNDSQFVQCGRSPSGFCKYSADNLPCHNGWCYVTDPEREKMEAELQASRWKEWLKMNGLKEK